MRSSFRSQGAFWGCLIAQLWGITRFILDIAYPAPACGDSETRPSFLVQFHEYYHAVSEILLAFVVAVVISLCTEAIPLERVNHQSAGFHQGLF